MGLLSLVRDNPKTGEGGMPNRVDDVVGRLYAYDEDGDAGANLCDTIENTAYIIPFGLFRLVPHDSEKHPNTLRIDIPGWSNILLHRGTVPPHSKGCVLVPEAIERWLAEHVRPKMVARERWQILVHEPPKRVI